MRNLNERMKARGQGGFTLIELLVVIAILGILAGVVVFAVGNVTDNAENQACAIERRTINTAIQAYRGDNNGDWPTAIGDLVPEWLESNPAAPPTITFGTASTPTTVSACP